MAKTRYARKGSKRKGATKRRANTKRRVMKKKVRAATKRSGGNLLGKIGHLGRRVGNFGSKGIKTAASGVESAARSAATMTSDAARSAATRTSDAARSAASKAHTAVENVKAAAADSSCVGVDEELGEAERNLERAQAKVQRLKDRQDVCNPAYGLDAMGL